MADQRHVLVIDDSEIMLTRAKQALVAAGYHVTTTTQAVGNAKYLITCDLVLIDYHMPGIHGGTVMQSLRSALAALDRPCLCYVYTSDPAVSANYQQLGFDGCIGSKGDEDSLVRQVNSIFRMAKIRELSARKNRT
jgi:DNA-binding NarL/FixJ family response regulator